jgi:Fe-coproporphyrin III synthase
MQRIAGPTQDYRVVQVHPLLGCNLRCLHCYSSSGPAQTVKIPIERLLPAIDLFRAEGFNAMAVSGGEPLLYPDLSRLLRHARGLGMIATVSTNAMLINDERAEALRRDATLVAVSLDGSPDWHNRMRGHPRAFDQMTEGVRRLKRAGVPFGFIFTMTLHNLHELEWVLDFSVKQGASLLQVHPLEEVGRAAQKYQGGTPDGLELARGFVEVARLQQQYRDRINIRFDVADSQVLRADPARGFAVESDACGQGGDKSTRLSDLLAPVVVEADGAVVPLQYSFARAYQIGDVYSDRLEAQISAWKRDTFPRFISLCRGLHGKLAQASSEFPFFNWYSEVLRESLAAATVGDDQPELSPALSA